jgi:hypothetical protein
MQGPRKDLVLFLGLAPLKSGLVGRAHKVSLLRKIDQPLLLSYLASEPQQTPRTENMYQ